MKPVIRWVGGKTKQLPEILKRLPTSISRYYEPFLGGAAVLLGCEFADATVADQNFELINFYECVKQNPQAVLALFRGFTFDEPSYYQIRSWDRSQNFSLLPSVDRAARFLFLNKMSFQGLWRVNRKGQHNVPFGKRVINPLEVELQGLSDRIQNVTFVCDDFERAIENAAEGDFVYLDPPYLNTFDLYTSQLFGLSEHERLRDACLRLTQKGVKFLLSNSDNDAVRQLYSMFKIDSITVTQLVAAKSASRGRVNEVLIQNY